MGLGMWDGWVVIPFNYVYTYIKYIPYTYTSLASFLTDDWRICGSVCILCVGNNNFSQGTGLRVRMGAKKGVHNTPFFLKLEKYTPQTILCRVKTENVNTHSLGSKLIKTIM